MCLCVLSFVYFIKIFRPRRRQRRDFMLLWKFQPLGLIFRSTNACVCVRAYFSLKSFILEWHILLKECVNTPIQTFHLVSILFRINRELKVDSKNSNNPPENCRCQSFNFVAFFFLLLFLSHKSNKQTFQTTTTTTTSKFGYKLAENVFASNVCSIVNVWAKR